MKKKLAIAIIIIISVFLAVVFFYGRTDIYVVHNTGTPAQDSISLFRSDSLITLNISNRIKPRHYSSQIWNDGTHDEYIVLDENKLYKFDLNADSLIKTIPLSECGNLNNYSGFYYLNPDSIFAYNYAQKTLYLANSEGAVYNTFSLKDIDNEISPEALNQSSIKICDGYAVLAGAQISRGKSSKDDHIAASINLATGEAAVGASYPDEYSKGFFGGVYFNNLYNCKDSQNRIVFSFPASNYIYRYDTDLNLIDSLYMGSRYISDIASTTSSPLDIIKDKEERIKYYVSQPSYSNILYDPYNDLYYRFASQPFKEYDGGKFIKPFSIIAMTPDGNIISETPVAEDYNSLYTSNAQVCKQGLIIQRYTEDENIAQFTIYKLAE